jgi:hypothetical protein
MNPDCINQKFGDVDTSSAKGFFGSLRGSTANKNVTPPPPVVPSAFAPRKNEFVPPPVRRVGSGTAAAPAKQPEEPAGEEEEEGGGDWAEALYEYSSTARMVFFSVLRVFSDVKLFIGSGGSRVPGEAEGVGFREDVG